MRSSSFTDHTILRVLSGLLLLSVAAPAMAETQSWPVPPQNTEQGCVGRGSGDDLGAPLDVQIHDRYGPYRGDQVVMVSDMSGMPVVTLACDGSQDQFRLRPGSYRVQAFIADAARSPEVVVDVPSGGTRIALTMSDEPNQSFDTPNID